MRILIKGGVWKNTEDEILKAAVMKYGKNQWARVASLMNRKSAKQCKARWYEWLDPSIKKTEWTREEEEKLLHLAKLMPNQWRTIAPIVGRTAGQCMEHYEKLLDQAQADEEEAPSEDARRLRPGEIDPTPETKPARPDPIDMDEDEKEMLSEARARLANTKGKKAKRKARERMLEESRRMSMLQKRRELKAAGIESRLNTSSGKKRKFMDYAREIPFQKVPPTGFYDVNEENEVAGKMELDPKKHGIELGKLEGRDEREDDERQRQRDRKLMKELFKENAPAAIMKMSEYTDPVALRKRLPLQLPSPQISEMELEEVVRLGKQTLMGPPEGLPSHNRATEALVGDYTNAFKGPNTSSTPMRTPVQEDIIMQEARNLRALSKMTPLIAQELPELYEGTGFDGITPRRPSMTTPNAFMGNTPARGSSINVGATPQRGGGSIAGGSSVSRGGGGGQAVTIRDSFGLNAAIGDHNDTFSVSDVSTILTRADRERMQASKQQLLAQLQSLPEPEYIYEVALPTVVDDEMEVDVMIDKPEDAADIEARLQLEREQQREAELARRSTVLKRGLPRPAVLRLDMTKPSLNERHHPTDHVQASAMINEEMLMLLAEEERKYPLEYQAQQLIKSRLVVKRLPDRYQHDMVVIDSSDLDTARAMIAVEARKIANEDQVIALANEIAQLQQQMMFVPDANGSGTGSFRIPVNQQERLDALMAQFANIEGRFEKDRKKVSKVENKFQVHTQGYRQRHDNLHASIVQSQAEYAQAMMDYDGMTTVRDEERQAAQYRLDCALDEALRAEELEAESQRRYADIMAFARMNDIAF